MSSMFVCLCRIEPFLLVSSCIVVVSLYTLYVRQPRPMHIHAALQNKFKVSDFIDKIGEQFGKKIAFYFAFQTFYTRWLVGWTAGTVC